MSNNTYDFYRIQVTPAKKDFQVIAPEFLVKPRLKDIMVRGGKFYAIVDKNTGFWTTNEGMVQEVVDSDINRVWEEAKKNAKEETVFIRKEMQSFRSRSWIEYKQYVGSLPDNFHQLDNRLCFLGEEVKPEDYISKCLPYALKQGKHESWDELVGTLYLPEEKEKIEWAIGSIVSGDSKDIQKFVVLYGDPGAGKGTIIEIIKKLFTGYYEVFDAKSISNNNNAFAFEQFRSNPLVALQSDGDLSRIEDNTKINSIVSHETVVMNEKRKQSYNFTPHCFLFMASNKPVKITDAKSGIIRRLIDVTPSGVTLPKSKYDILMERINFELGAIAWHCREVYRDLGKNYYNGYRPLRMMYQTDAFFNFMEDNYDVFNDGEGVELKNAYEMWKTYCADSGMDIHLPRYKFREEFKNYFTHFEERAQVNGVSKYSWFTGFRTDRFKSERRGRKDIPVTGRTIGLVLDQKKSILDDILKDCQAQYAEDDGNGGSKPIRAWNSVDTTLKNLDTSRLHFVRPPKNHIVIDFDLKNENGEKDILKNLEAADRWPKTYAEYSQGGKGVHLHYIYDGDPNELASVYDKNIEVKVFGGKSSLRRRLSLCNNIPIATINGDGLPKKEVKDNDMIDFDSAKDEKHIRNIIAKCLKKDIAQPYTAPAMSLIKKTLDDAYQAGIKYDIRDMRPAIRKFAASSSHQKQACMRMCEELRWFSKHFDDDHKWDGSIAVAENTERISPNVDAVETKVVPRYVSEELVFFDVEVFPNLFLVNWKEAGEGKGVARMINPTRSEIGQLLRYKLVGFNCRRYDNHIIYARYIGYDNEALYRLSQRIISGSKNSMFGQAYDLSYTDVYDFAAKKQSLKKWEIELGIHHQELGLPWDQPVPEEKWTEVAEYCDNDVIATEAVFNKLAGDFKAREILADIAGMSVNDTTNMLTTRIIFGDDPKPQVQFNYPDLAKKFPGYKFENGKSTLNGVEVGEGGRVYANPGIYHDVVTYDVASMHPSSIIAENGFGKYTERFKQLMDIRVAIKHKDFDKAKQMLDGKLAKYLTDKDQAKALSQALKIAINSVYGLTAAGFDNKFRDPRNKDNWVAKRGALFMETLRLEVQKMGATVVHIKTDSIKIEKPTKEITNYILKRGQEFGYTFEVEDIYEKICLVNDAVYIALRDKTDPGWLDECEKAKKEGKPKPTRWTATGAQFQHPYVFKTLFSHDPIEFNDLCETKTVTSALYLDLNENLTDVSLEEKDLEKLQKRVKSLLKDLGYLKSYSEWLDEVENGQKHEYHPIPSVGSLEIEQIEKELLELNKDANALTELINKGHNYIFIGKAGSFCPVRNGLGGGILCREKDGKYYSATGAKGYRWREGESLKGADRMDMIDMGYFENLAKTAREAVDEFAQKVGMSFEDFASENRPAPKKEKEPAFLTIDEVLDRSDEMFRKSGEPGHLPWLAPCGENSCIDCKDRNEETCLKGYDISRILEL